MGCVNSLCLLMAAFAGFISAILALDGFLTYYMTTFTFGGKAEIQEIMFIVFLIVAIQSCIIVILTVFFLIGYKQATRKRIKLVYRPDSIN